MAEEIRADYKDLENISRRFTQESERIQQILSTIDRALIALQNGGWRGSGADAFYSEMNNIVIPALNRLMNALAQSGEITDQMVFTFLRAEKEARDVFNSSNTTYRL